MKKNPATEVQKVYTVDKKILCYVVLVSKAQQALSDIEAVKRWAIEEYERH